MEKPFSAACERNREPILDALQQHFADRERVLEIGSGTGQHAVFFASAMPQLIWQTSDREENLAGIRMWLDEARLPNTPTPMTFDVNDAIWPPMLYDALYSANTLHIMSWAEVERLFARLPEIMTESARLAIYGPFNSDGQFTSPSNAAFDASLRARAPHMGIRDRADVDALARAAGLNMIEDRELPANNRCIVWQRNIEAR
ncbi:MAG: DUF938 domain-containing protein [Dokdonella sp.]